MNYIWPALMIISLIFASINGRIDETVAALFSGADLAVQTALGMAGVFCFWSGLLKLAEKSGFADILAKVISPVIGRIFPRLKKGDKARGFITMNVVANLLGMGNAATPSGINAMHELDKLNGGSPNISEEMCLLVVMNTASIQLIPTTILALRSASASPAAVVVPIWIVSAISLAAAMGAMILINRRCRKL